MKTLRLVLPSLLLGGAALLILPGQESQGFSKIGGSLGVTQRDVRVFNNFGDAASNNNTTPASQYPGWDGAELAIWKGLTEWASDPFGDGSGDVSGNVLGGTDSNFDAFWAGGANGIGGTNDNIASTISSCGGGTLAYCETPISNGWRIRFCENWTWADGPSFIPGNQFDLQGVMCHEYGHALGLGHSTVGSATMFPSASQGSTGIRSIATDDVNGVRCVYGDEANDKPRIESSTVNGNTLELFGANFSAFNNQVWFTRASNSSTGSDPRVIASSVASTQAGTAISVNIPAAAGPGNVMVVASGAANGSDMSNAWPFSLTDGFGDPPNPPMMVTGISPANIPALVPGTAETVTLTGSGFLGVQQVMFFIPPIDTQIDPSRWTIVNDTTITIDMPQALQLGSIPITVFDGQNFASINGNFVEVSSPQLQLGNGDAFNIVDTDFGMEVIVAGQVGSLHYLFGSANALPSSSPSVNLDIGNNFSSLIFLGTVTIGPDGYTTLNFTPAQLPNPPNAIVRYAQSIQLTLPTPVPVSNLGIVTFAP